MLEPSDSSLKAADPLTRPQPVDRVSKVHRRPVPGRQSRERIDLDVETERIVDAAAGSRPNPRQRGRIGDATTIRPVEACLAGREQIDPKALLVDRAMVAATEQHQVV